MDHTSATTVDQLAAAAVSMYHIYSFRFLFFSRSKWKKSPSDSPRLHDSKKSVRVLCNVGGRFRSSMHSPKKKGKVCAIDEGTWKASIRIDNWYIFKQRTCKGTTTRPVSTARKKGILALWRS